MITAIAAVALASTATFLSCFLAFLSYGHHRRQALTFWRRERQLPLATRYEHLQSLVEQMQADYESLRDQIFDARELIDEADRRRQWLETVREEVAQLEQEKSELARVQNELETRQVELGQLQEAIGKLETEKGDQEDRINQLKTEHVELLKEVEGLREEAKRAESVRSEIRELETARDAVNQQIEQLQRNMRELREKYENELRGLKRECQEAETERDASRKKLDDLAKELDSLAQQKKDIDHERRKLEREVEELEGRAASLKGQIPTLQTAFDLLTSAVQPSTESPDAQESEIWKPVFLWGDETESAKRSESEYLQLLEKDLQRQGLRFDQRTVYAFHTALKTTTSSPLVTLAGVSGTGKSELPRRYADALGLNFLNMSVQPRWDSPQDLFGFYDYLERRFRATELTRALIQMDPVGPAEERGWTPPDGYDAYRRENQMLLVLLDEMNLARVEYYFSEFLSKLETRRGVDPRNRDQREPAEIALEVSGRRAGNPPLRLFVDTNVLFVGTMNEDESTQALSDKVVDRSNVLRFGSPNVIDPMGGIARGPEQPRSVERLSRKTWESWCRSLGDLGGEEKNQLLQWIRDLREALDRIGRPFAYRVAHAILEYAANYPQTNDRAQHAIADQIEQRILPKLIGLDLQQSGAKQALKTITNILEEVDDNELAERITKAGRDDYFQWRGLDRTKV